MKRIMVLAAAAVGLMASGPNGSAARQTAAKHHTVTTAQLLDQARQTVQQIESDGRYAELLKTAKAVFIAPDVVKATLVHNSETSPGVLMRHNPDGSWSQPAFMTIGSISLKPQPKSNQGPVAMLLMTDKAEHDFAEANHFSLNGKANLRIIKYAPQGQAPTAKGDVVVWSEEHGAFAGVQIGGTDLMQDASRDRSYYGKQVEAEDILAGKATNPGAKPLVAALPG